MTTTNLNHVVSVYRELLAQGDVQAAYSELVKYVQRLKTVFSKNLGVQYTVGNVFQGYMDYTYFYLSNDYLKRRKLKLALVFNHPEVRFEIWLLGQTKDVQEKYWQLLKGSKWIKGQPMPQYSVIEATLVNKPNFNSPNELTEKLERKFALTANEIMDAVKSA